MNRECGDCCECCMGSLHVVIEGETVSKTSPCKYCDKGCTVHDNQPEDVCRDFSCGWLQGELEEDMRPDKSGVILIPTKYMWEDQPIDMAVPTKTHIPQENLEKLITRSDSSNVPLLYYYNEGETKMMYINGDKKYQDIALDLHNQNFGFY